MKLFTGIIFLSALAMSLVGCSPSAPVTSKQVQNAARTSDPIASDIKRTELSADAKYAAELKIEPDAAKAGEDVTLNFTVKDKQGNVTKNLQFVHEKLMHLLVVSDDLAQFDHVHPEFNEADGTFKLKYKFPNGGVFKLYTDFTPQNSSQIVNVFDVSINGSKREKTPLVADKELSKNVEGLTFTVKVSQPIKAAVGTMLDFYVTDSATGKPITDLQPYLGAMAHFVVISEDTSKFLHVHAMEGKTTKAAGTEAGHSDKHGDMGMDVKPSLKEMGNPTVQAHTEFPTGGLYKLWGQFQRGGKIFTVPFVLNISPAETKTATVSDIKDAIKITVSSGGFEPSSIKLKKDQPTRLAFFRKDGENCGTEVIFSKLNIKQALSVGTTTVVEIPPQKEGEISFACGMGMMKGKLEIL